jgi:hypothetical protein
MDKLLELAKKLPSGLNDPRALDKFRNERRELYGMMAEGDRIGALLEAGDCLYYLVKAWHNGLISAEQYITMFDEIEKSTAFISQGWRKWLRRPAFSKLTIRAAAIAKYTLRAKYGNPKDDGNERAAVAHLVDRDYVCDGSK